MSTIPVTLNVFNSVTNRTANLADVRDSRKRTPLMLAVEGGHEQCTDVLLCCNSQIDLFDVNHRSALHRAAWKGLEDCVSSLLEAKASFLPDKTGKTCCHLAAAMGHSHILKLLIQHCDARIIWSTDSRGFHALHWAAYKGAFFSFKIYLIIRLYTNY